MKNAFLEIITAAFATGETKVYAMAGEYFEIIDSVYPVDVRLVDRYGAQRGIMRNAENSYYIKAGDFDTIEITSASAQTVRFAFGSSEAGTRRTAGVVQVVDGSRALVQSGAAFIGYGDAQPVAAMNSQVQLWNPAGSGKNLIVKSLFVTADAVRIYAVRHGTVIMPNAVGTGNPRNKLLGSAAATVAQLRFRNDTAVVEGALMGPLIYVVANDSKGFVFNEPIIVQPGNGLNVSVNNVNAGAFVTYDFFEVAI